MCANNNHDHAAVWQALLKEATPASEVYVDYVVKHKLPTSVHAVAMIVASVAITKNMGFVNKEGFMQACNDIWDLMEFYTKGEENESIVPKT